MYLCLIHNLKYCSIILKCKIKNKFQNMSRHSILTCLESWFLPLGKDIRFALQILNLFTKTPNNCENKNKTDKGMCHTSSFKSGGTSTATYGSPIMLVPVYRHSA